MSTKTQPGGFLSTTIWPMTGPLGITGLAELAAQVPTNDWYELRIVFRRVPSGAEVRACKDIRRAEIVPEENSDD